MRKALRLIFSRFGLGVFLIFLEIIEILIVFYIIQKFFVYIWILFFITNFVLYIAILNSNDNPDYKIPWITIILLLPPLGALLYSLFYTRKLSKKEIKHHSKIKEAISIIKLDDTVIDDLKNDDTAYSQALYLIKEASLPLYRNSRSEYFSLGELMYEQMLEDLKNAKEFIFLEYFIIEEGVMWNQMLEILEKKVKIGIEVRVLYDDIGCMSTLPLNYEKQLRNKGIKCYSFNKISASSPGKPNNRDHRKFLIIDGKIGYTGGINLADEYINLKIKFGHWKDGGIRLEGSAVKNMLIMFLSSWDMNSYTISDYQKYFKGEHFDYGDGYYLPFGDGPKPIYKNNIAKDAILNIVNQAKKYIYITTPYLIIDYELTNAIILASKRGVDIRIITPHIPDQKLIHLMTRSSYNNFINAGVSIYEYSIGFMHAKTIISDDLYGIVGTINLDYRSLIHHYEDGVWMYKTAIIGDIKKDFEDTINISTKIEVDTLKIKLTQKVLQLLVKFFAPLL